MFDGDQVNVEALITIQDFRFIKSDSLSDRKSDLVLVRDFLLTLSSNFKGPNLIYLMRSNALFRPMYQRKYFLNKIAKIGFEIVNPEELSLTEQINLFHNTKILVSESGAALTNIFLLPKSCKVVEIHPMPNKAGLWGELAALFDIDLAVVYGKPMKIRNFLSGIGAYRINQRRTILMLQKMKQETL
jgi:capsular polysaccharide biosynthesis protein